MPIIGGDAGPMMDRQSDLPVAETADEIAVRQNNDETGGPEFDRDGRHVGLSEPSADDEDDPVARCRSRRDARRTFDRPGYAELLKIGQTRRLALRRLRRRLYRHQ